MAEHEPSICRKKNCGAKMKGPLICCDDKRRYICPKCNHSRVVPAIEMLDVALAAIEESPVR